MENTLANTKIRVKNFQEAATFECLLRTLGLTSSEHSKEHGYCYILFYGYYLQTDSLDVYNASKKREIFYSDLFPSETIKPDDLITPEALEKDPAEEELIREYRKAKLAAKNGYRKVCREHLNNCNDIIGNPSNYMKE